MLISFGLFRDRVANSLIKQRFALLQHLRMRFVLGNVGNFARIVFQICQNAVDRLRTILDFSPLRIAVVAKSNAVPRLFLNRWIDTVRTIAVLSVFVPQQTCKATALAMWRRFDFCQLTQRRVQINQLNQTIGCVIGQLLWHAHD